MYPDSHALLTEIFTMLNRSNDFKTRDNLGQMDETVAALKKEIQSWAQNSYPVNNSSQPYSVLFAKKDQKTNALKEATRGNERELKTKDSPRETRTNSVLKRKNPDTPTIQPIKRSKRRKGRSRHIT